MKPQPMSDPERNGRVSDLYNELARAGKHGHYESLYRIVKLEVERAIAARDAQWAAMIGEPVAYLKTWDSVGHAQTGMRRLDFKAESETWLANMFPEVSPLYAIKETP